MTGDKKKHPHLPTEAPTPVPIGSAAYQAEFLLNRRLERARISPRFAGKSLENFNARDKQRKMLVHSAQAYISGFSLKKEAGGYEVYPKGLLMTGPVGCGKSHLATAILRGVIEKGYSGLYYNSPDLLRDIRATFEPSSDLTEDDLLEEVTTVDLLVFDDVGAENATGFVLDRFYLIINERYEGCKPIIVTSNLELGEGGSLENRLGKRIVSRLIEMCEVFGPFPEEDWRRRNLR